MISNNYYYDFMNRMIIYECDINSCDLSLDTFHPRDIIDSPIEVISEAFELKTKIRETIDAILKFIEEASTKFAEIARRVSTKNAKWITQAEEYALSVKPIEKKGNTEYSYRIFPYWQGLSAMKIGIPPLKKEDYPLILNDDGRGFKEKYYKDYFVPANEINDSAKGDSLVVNKFKFLGAPEKIKINASQVPDIFKKCLSVVKSYKGLVETIKNQNAEIIKIERAVRIGTTVSESVLLNRSIFKDEYYDILLEEVTTPDEESKNMDKEDNTNTQKNKTIENNKEENKEDNSEKEKAQVLQKYIKICYSIQAVKMSVLEEAYANCSNFINSIMR